MKFCPQCGHELPGNSRFCGSCGASLGSGSEGSSPAPPSRSNASPEPPTHATAQSAHEPEYELPTRPVPQQHSSDDNADEATQAAPTYLSSFKQRQDRPFEPASSQAGYQSSDSGYRSSGPHLAESPSQQPEKRSKAPLIAGLAALAIALGGGGAYLLNKGGDKKAPTAQSSASTSGGVSAPTSAAGTSPEKMPNLTGKTLSDAQSLLGSKVKLVPTTNLVENMDGAEKITKQDPAAGSKTPGTVKVNVDQPANVTYIDQSNDLVVDNDNPFTSADNVSVNGTALDHAMTASMYGGEDQDPDTLRLNLNKSYQRFRSVVGVSSDSDDDSKQFTITIKADDHQLWRQTVGLHDAPKNIDLDVSNALRLSIEVTVAGGDDSSSSSVAFGSMRVLARPGSAAPESSSSN